MTIHSKDSVSLKICEGFTTHDRINLEHTVSPVLAETPSGAIKPALHPHGAGEPICKPDGRAGKEDVAMEDGYTFGGEQRLGGELGAVFGKEPKRSVEIDTAKYQEYLDDPSLSKEQKEEIIMALWSIITAFVDLGFGVHPAQEACGKAAEILDGQAKGVLMNPKLYIKACAMRSTSKVAASRGMSWGKEATWPVLKKKWRPSSGQ